MTIVYILLASFAVMLMSLVGIFTVMSVFKGWAERNLKYLATFATGVFIIVAYNLVTETFHSDIALIPLLGIMLVGALIAFSVDKIIPDSHHHHDDSETDQSHTKAGAKRIMFSDTLHNITDGFLIVPAFLVDVKLGLITTAGIMIHEIALEISEFFVLKSAGYSTKQALTINFITSGSILVGVLGALFISNISEDIVFSLLAIAAGIIVYTILKDLIPYSVSIARKEKTYTKHALAALAGIIIITGLTLFTQDSHVHSEDAHHEDAHSEVIHSEKTHEDAHSDNTHTEEDIHTDEENHL